MGVLEVVGYAGGSMESHYKLVSILENGMNVFGMFADNALVCGLLWFVFAWMAYTGTKLWLWSSWLFLTCYLTGVNDGIIFIMILVLGFLNFPHLRMVLSKVIMETLKALKFLPQVSETEKTALEAGNTWIDADLFSGRPNFGKINKELYPKLTDEEIAFMEGPVQQVCEMMSEWDIQCKRDLSPEVWQFIKDKGFFGIAIPKEFGGLGMSALAQSEIVSRLSTHSLTMGVCVMVPNSLGPGELLVHYGTKEQKDYYLPKLAKGQLVPCFALTEPQAGSDAGSISSSGEVFKDTDGQIKVKLNWQKRYITLAAIADVIGLAVKLTDPDNLLGKGTDLGITCVLVPSTTPGVVLGMRHDPVGLFFYNCPTEGKDVVVDLDKIIGGQEGAGRGWTMLMESLAAGRGISLPAQSSGGVKKLTKVASAYSYIRKQFGISIGKFEGIEEQLQYIYAMNYTLDAMRTFTAGAIMGGSQPSVVSAMAKFTSTEIGRMSAVKGMDILGGAGISQGPRNTIASGYLAAPIGITVEGANILTRTLIIFGQGAIRCHPYAWKEVKALEENNLRDFDRSFFGHIGFVLRNAIRCDLLYLTRGMLAPYYGSPVSKYYRKLSWVSANFAIMADLALGLFGGALKQKGKITGRYADVFNWMFLITSTLRRFEAEGRKKEHLPFVHWSCQYGFARIHEAMDGIYANFDVPVAGLFFKYVARVFHNINPMGSEPSDKLGNQIVSMMMKPSQLRDEFTTGVVVDPKGQIQVYEDTLKMVVAAEEVGRKMRKAVKAKKVPKSKGTTLVDHCLKAGVISQEEADVANSAEKARFDAIMVDSFTLEEYLKPQR